MSDKFAKGKQSLGRVSDVSAVALVNALTFDFPSLYDQEGKTIISLIQQTVDSGFLTSKGQYPIQEEVSQFYADTSGCDPTHFLCGHSLICVLQHKGRPYKPHHRRVHSSLDHNFHR